MEIVKQEDLSRFAVIDWMDLILFDSNDITECLNVYDSFGKHVCKGIYDYQQNMYLDEVDILDLTGCQIHSE